MIIHKLYVAFFYIIGTGSSSNAVVAPIGGAVGGTVLLILLITLCIVTMCMVWSYKRKKARHSINKPRFTSVSSTSSNIYEMGTAQRNSGVNARLCKYINVVKLQFNTTITNLCIIPATCII